MMWTFITLILTSGFLGHPAPGPGLSYQPSVPGPVKVLTISTLSQLNSSHFDHVYITFNGLRVN